MTGESREARAAALWVAREYGFFADKVSHVTFDVVREVTFDVVREDYCDTCGYDAPGVAFLVNGREWVVRELPPGMTAGDFIAACVALLPEVPS